MQQIAAASAWAAIHLTVAGQAGFHLPVVDVRITANVWLLPMPPHCFDLNPVERFGGLLKAAVSNHL